LHFSKRCPFRKLPTPPQNWRATTSTLGAIIVNRASPRFLPEDQLAGAAAGNIDAASIRSTLSDVGIDLSDDDFAGLLTETIEHAAVLEAQESSAEKLREIDGARVQLPALADGVDLGGLYELAEYLTEQGV
jgi:hypothetical protein